MNKIKFFVAVSVFFSVASFLLVFGFFSGICIAALSVSSDDVQSQRTYYRRSPYEMCTCVPCLPNHYCRKCRHMSFDCPKVRAYRQTNLVIRASSTNKVNRIDAKTQGTSK